MDALQREWAAGEGEAVVDRGPPVFDLVRPVRLMTPLVFASPHSGRFYPPQMMAASALDSEAIRRSEDAYVDVLVESAAEFGAPLIAARYARAYIDVNREPYELDPAMFEDELPAFASSRTARVAAGLGSIARVVAEGQEIYRGKLTFGDARQRIEQVHRPYHRALAALVEEARREHGLAILIDWHSMPSAAAGSRPGAPDFVLGDRFGAACNRLVTTVLERHLQAAGYTVARNAPYAGGHTTEFYGRPSRGVHAIQVEINRALYLDERRMEPHAGLDALQRHLRTCFAGLAATDWSGIV
jgi:N-formylglutamate amidohydrolase